MKKRGPVWKYARQVGKEMETRMYCKILFSFYVNVGRFEEEEEKKKKKINKSPELMFVIVCLPMPYDLDM